MTIENLRKALDAERAERVAELRRRLEKNGVAADGLNELADFAVLDPTHLGDPEPARAVRKVRRKAQKLLTVSTSAARCARALGDRDVA